MNSEKTFIREIIIGFLLMRIMTIMWYQPIYSEFLDYHFLLAQSSNQGFYPFIHYWMEYPPIFPWISVIIYQLSENIFSSPNLIKYFYFLFISLLMILAETGILYFCFALAKKLYNEKLAQKCCMYYIVLFFPLCGTASYFDSFPAFFFIAAVYFILQRKNIVATIYLAIGAMIKVIPIILLPLLWLKSDNKVRILLVFSIIVFATLVPFLIYDNTWIVAFAEVTLKRQAWETPWALLDQQYSFGYLGPTPQQANKVSIAEARFQSRFSPDTSFLATPSTFFQQVYLIAGLCFIGFFLYVFFKLPNKINDHGTVCFAMFSLLLFFLYSKGWSPQFLIYLIPLFIVALPEKFYLLLLLSVVNFIELRIWLFFFPNSIWFITLLILVRTFLFLYLLVILGKCIYEEKTCQVISEESVPNE